MCFHVVKQGSLINAECPPNHCVYIDQNAGKEGRGSSSHQNLCMDIARYGSLHCTLIILVVILIYSSFQYPEHPVIPEAPKPNADTLENLQKQLNIEMQVKKGAENLILAYSKAPSKVSGKTFRMLPPLSYSLSSCVNQIVDSLLVAFLIFI